MQNKSDYLRFLEQLFYSFEDYMFETEFLKLLDFRILESIRKTQIHIFETEFFIKR